MRAMANTTMFGGIGVLLLMLAATMLSVAFATRGAMAANRPIVEVLHFIGAKDGFIAGQFQRHFLVLGLEGGLIGGGAAIVRVHAGRAGRQMGRRHSPAASSLRCCSARSCSGIEGYVAIVVQVVVIAVVTALTSRRTVNQTLRTVE